MGGGMGSMRGSACPGSGVCPLGRGLLFVSVDAVRVREPLFASF